MVVRAGYFSPASYRAHLPRPSWMCCALFLILYVIQCAWFIATQSLTYDEPIHIAAGLEAWRAHSFATANDHPPLARMWCTLPIVGYRWQLNAETSSVKAVKLVTMILPDPEALAHRSRAMNVILGVVLGLLLWTTTRRMFSTGAANVALALYAFSPSLVAHFSLVTTDGAATLLIFATAVYLARWGQDPSRRHTALLGVLLGLLLLAKFSTPSMFLLAGLWMLVSGPQHRIIDPRRWNWGKACCAAAIACVLLWANYFFHISRLTVYSGEVRLATANRPPKLCGHMPANLDVSLPIPAGEYLEGLCSVLRTARSGRPAFLLGQIAPSGGFKLYFPITVLLKWPLAVWVLSVGAILLTTRRRLALPPDWMLLASFPIAYFALAIFSRQQIGERHVLPIYPFVLLFAAGVWQFARGRRAISAAVICILLLHCLDALRYAPDYLSYFTPLAQRWESYRLLSDSNQDWGQGLLALRNYQRAHPHQQLSLAYFGTVDPSVYGIQTRLLGEHERASGAVVVSATVLSGEYLDKGESYDWLLQFPLVSVLNHSLYVFQVPEPAVEN